MPGCCKASSNLSCHRLGQIQTSCSSGDEGCPRYTAVFSHPFPPYDHLCSTCEIINHPWSSISIYHFPVSSSLRSNFSHLAILPFQCPSLSMDLGGKLPLKPLGFYHPHLGCPWLFCVKTRGCQAQGFPACVARGPGSTRGSPPEPRSLPGWPGAPAAIRTWPLIQKLGKTMAKCGM